MLEQVEVKKPKRKKKAKRQAAEKKHRHKKQKPAQNLNDDASEEESMSEDESKVSAKKEGHVKKKKGLTGKGTKKPKAASPPKKDNLEKVRKSSFYDRKTSSAYHSARLKAQKMGLSPESCKREARAAREQMAHEIQMGLVKEEQKAWEDSPPNNKGLECINFSCGREKNSFLWSS